MEDNLLVSAAARGDQQAFSVLFERYRLLVYSIAYKVTLNEEDALDITQEVFLRVAGKISEFGGRGSFRAWLVSVATNETFSYLRRAPRRREQSAEPQEIVELAEKAGHTHPHSAREAAGTAEERRLVAQAMAELSPQQRAIITLQVMEDIAPCTIAERLGVPAAQVRSQLHRAITKLREVILGHGKPRQKAPASSRRG